MLSSTAVRLEIVKESRKNSLCITKETPFLRGPVKRSHGVTLLDRERPLVLYNVHVCDGFSDKILAARCQGLAHETSIEELWCIEMPGL